jgi:HD-GYP domain-containing protein (c-di-GMP phosphodiesterase class II)
MIVEKDISRVSIGSYIVRLLASQNDQQQHLGQVKDLKTIESLIDLGVERVLIDTTKSKIQTTPKPKKRNIAAIPNLKKLKVKSFAESLYQAKQVFEEAKSVQQLNIEQIINKQALVLKPNLEVVAEIIKHAFERDNGLVSYIYCREKSEYLLEHPIVVAVLMAKFCQQMKFERKIVSELVLGAFLLDTGKVLIDGEILNRPTKHNVIERELIKSHVNQSINIIKSTHGIGNLSVKVVAQHHERLDGSGYPKGIDHRAISQYGRMIAICDTYAALTSDNVHRNKIAQVKAFSVLLDMANNNRLDLLLVNHFIKALGIFPIGSIVELSNQHLAMVEELNSEEALNPVVRQFYDLRTTHFVSSKRVDLAVHNSIKIKRGINSDDHKLISNRIIEFLTLNG